MIWRLLILVLGLLSLAAGGAPVSPARGLPMGSAALTVGEPQEAASAIREQSERSTFFKAALDSSPSAVTCDPFPDLPPAAVRELEPGEETFFTPRPASGRAARARAPPALG